MNTDTSLISNREAPLLYYKPLNVETREIRLVTILPGDFDDEIHCTLSLASLDDPLDYEALSYVWGETGNPDLMREVFIDGVLSSVTINLEVALRYLRYKSEPRVMWIDAICINQKDNDERGSQVMHMGSVYSMASRVVAWLGGEHDDSDLAFDAFQALPATKEEHWDSEMNSSFDPCYLDSKYLIAIRNVMRRPWWQRVWIIQESILASTLLFACGNRSILADKISAMHSSCDFHRYLCCRKVLWSRRPLQTSESITLWYWRNMNLRARPDRPTLSRLLSSFRNYQCCDPRDKIYGLLGLCSRPEKGTILPNYSKDISTVYQQVVLNTIDFQKSLEIFSHLGFKHSSGSSSLKSLPSWVPSWDLEIERHTMQALQWRQNDTCLYNASENSNTCAICLEPGVLTLKGILLQDLGVIGPPWDSLRSIEVSNQWQEIAGVTTYPGRTYDSKTGTTYYEAYCQTICGSVPSHAPPSQNPLGDYYLPWTISSLITIHDAWWNRLVHNRLAKKLDKDPEAPRPELDAFGKFVSASTCLRSLFVSKDGSCFGLAPNGSEIGDVIALLAGGLVPYILRPKCELGVNFYEIIGDAYVHGIMDGEAWNSTITQDINLV
ncbi:hypothetical protein HYFRA_00011752 [Hymenoscyphus fraxineus]|uniref:Heterokaryon incompatibility domain-containing protein n=1 Tax=Hymenoscyphus fraxineus TaxID=746836 RepID=A0A9N9L588_9HELO|nr:hypothetical protein HYFRA_00011752 [Hymenoscyphus fraxineus]